ncbi:DUF6232 family protein [Stigmatella aurantiaca]|uniref:Conserved uncharacterized protein n=1 Tax=Stigmatella aurantiaca (strain DW4/3-1) TaxID=378806 RepID=Q08Q12_STIAD|nr:DUF6232 family protein [Stigmatella aurantiaca]ADO72636.1 conserved uncharacterized protein [Stigmatella aurantiaca DW4/3-1]EAU62572.1 hypothetical protein STIAU_0015 [Stigmatella aurantiaca DW4/3-1]
MSESLARPVALPSAENTLFQADGVLVTTERLVAGGRAWPLGEVLRVEAIHRAPRVIPLLVLLGASMMLGLPAVMTVMASSEALGPEVYAAALGCLGVVAFGSIAGLLVAQDDYWLVLRTRRSELRVFHSRDRQHISRLAQGVSEAIQAARLRS